MASTRRTRTIKAPAERVWEVLQDPHHMPRWWPGVTRMESVEEERFTQVFKTKKGRPVRMDFQVVASEPPGAGYSGSRVWSQEVEGSPFERVLTESVIEVVLEPEGDQTKVTIAQRQKLRGYSKTGGFLLKRATRSKLDEALDGLERVVG
jgi:carbon monoxide dehydrogenase subunit G